MRVYRFCSRREMRKLLRGEVIRSDTDHYRGGRGGSTSRGFCLTAEAPEKAWKYLKGIVCPEVCMRLEIPDGKLKVAWGKYAREFKGTADGRIVYTTMRKREWCTGELRPEWLRQVIPVEQIERPETLATVRMLYALLHPEP